MRRRPNVDCVILSLLLQFRTEVPEQLVVLDPNMAAVDENYVRILQRYRESVSEQFEVSKPMTASQGTRSF